MRRQRTPAEKGQHARSERQRYKTLKAGLIAGIMLKAGLRFPHCMMPKDSLLNPVCQSTAEPFEIDHVHFTRRRQRPMNSVQRLEMFAAELVRWIGGDASRELRIACRSCNAAHQPPKKGKK